MTRKEIGERLMQIRQEKRITKEKLIRNGIASSHSYICKIERGEANITIDKVIEWLELLGGYELAIVRKEVD